MEENFIWSGTDFPYMCLIDINRTQTFKKAIEETVKPGDVVVDVGSGTGILAFFAAKAGAKKVYAVEIDHLMAESLRTSVKLNGLQDVVEVVESDALEAELPPAADVVLAELIETGLLDEMQVRVMNQLRSKGVITDKTKIIPGQYETFIRLLEVRNDFYGFKMAAPIHDWPFYSHNAEEWHQLQKDYATEPKGLGKVDFQRGPVEPWVDQMLEFEIPSGKKINSLELSGMSHLSQNIVLGPAHSYNGNKILYLDEISGPVKLKIRFSYEMSRGLGNFKYEVQS